MKTLYLKLLLVVFILSESILAHAQPDTALIKKRAFYFVYGPRAAEKFDEYDII